METQSDQRLNILPFAARAFWSSPNDYEIWWEDPRDIYQVRFIFATGKSPKPVDFKLAYWRNSWPKVRVEKGAVVGAGESGWLANDDWTNGDWQPADVVVMEMRGSWSVSFKPIGCMELPQFGDLDFLFRRTLKLKLHFERRCSFDKIEVYTDSVLREGKICLAWKSVNGEQVDRGGYLEAFNGEVLSI